MRSQCLLLLLIFAFVNAGCTSRIDDGRAFLSQPSRASAQPTSTIAPSRSKTPVSTTGAVVTRGGIGIGQAGASGQLPVLVFIDPGHGGVDVGTQGTTLDGATVYEKNVSLAISTRVQRILRDDGIGAILSRPADALLDLTPVDYSPDRQLLTPGGVLHDLQNRINRANASGAMVLLSIHLNAYSDPAVGGSETFYDGARPFANDNQRFARLIQNAVVAALHGAGYSSPDRGIADDTTLESDGFGTLGVPYHHLVLLGPAVPGRLKPTQLPGALSEPLFLSNPGEATLAAKPETQDLIARAYATAIEQFLRG